MDLIGDLAVEKNPAFDLALAHALVRQCADGTRRSTLRIYRPRRSMVVFGRRDTRLPGYPDAVRAAREEGFAPAIRVVGGRPVAHTPKSVVIDQVGRESRALERQQSRFADFGLRFTSMLRELGVDARLGAVPGEYCPGAYSVNARGTVKLVGTAQRVLARAWLFSSLITVGDADRVRRVLARVYAAVDLPFDSAAVGSLASENPDLTPAAVVRAAAAWWGAGVEVAPGPDLLSLADALVADHLVLTSAVRDL